MEQPQFWATLALALGLAFAIEGMFYAFFAPRVPEFAQLLMDMDPAQIRRVGVAAAVVGLGLMLLVRYAWFG